MTTATNSPTASAPIGPRRRFVTAALPAAILLLSTAMVASGQRLDGPEVEIARGVRLATQSIAGIGNGAFTAAFIRRGTESSGHDLFVRSFRPNGSPRTGWNRLMRLQPGAFAGIVQLAMQDDRSYEGVAAADIRLRRFGADCSPAGPRLVVETGPRDRQTPRVASAPNGGLAVAYVEWQGENTFYDVILQRLDADGTATGPRDVVTDGDTQWAFQDAPGLAFAADGRLLVTWDDREIDRSYLPSGDFDDRQGIGAQLYAADGSRRGGNQRVNLRAEGDQWGSTPLARRDGDFLVLWTSGGDQDGDGDGIYSRVVSSAGLVTGPEERVNLTTRGNQAGAVAFLRPSGNGAAVWSSTRTAGGVTRLLGRRLRPDP